MEFLVTGMRWANCMICRHLGNEQWVEDLSLCAPLSVNLAFEINETICAKQNLCVAWIRKTWVCENHKVMVLAFKENLLSLSCPYGIINNA